jgi:tetratricopeptide (TPR) repeat protein
MSKQANYLLGISISILTAGLAYSSGRGEPLLRKMKIGDKMPEFSLADRKAEEFEYQHNRKRILVVAFLSPGQKQSKSAVDDITRILADARIDSGPLDVVGVMTRPPEADFKPPFTILLDSKYKLWGELGVIAMPTVLIVGKDDKISWIKAGHSYDFAPALKSHLKFELGIGDEEAPEETVEARALSNKTIASRVKRHLQMAKMLEEKGRIDSAIAEVRKAHALDPDSVESALELGELLCRVGKGKEALETIDKAKTLSRRDTARKLVTSGWAKRQMGNLQTAQEDLLEAVKLDPSSARGHYELGKVYLAKGDKDNALAAYQQALFIVFDEE